MFAYSSDLGSIAVAGDTTESGITYIPFISVFSDLTCSMDFIFKLDETTVLNGFQALTFLTDTSMLLAVTNHPQFGHYLHVLNTAWRTLFNS